MTIHNNYVMTTAGAWTPMLGGSDGTLSVTTGAAAPAVTWTDASIANASGSSEIVAVANPARQALIISNPGAVSWWINASGGTAAANTAGSFELPAGSRWEPVPPPANAVTGIAAAGTDLTVKLG